MHRIIMQLLAALAVALLPVVAIPATAHAEADTRPCVTKDEFQDVETRNMPDRPGWTYDRVRDHFDSDGVVTWTLTDHGDLVEKGWTWNSCGFDGTDYVDVTFRKYPENLRAIQKHAY